ncbi:Uncharacterised protein [Vibrio cholerae]|nr:Uncharacterised protein [Vibrio cholerae]
MRRRCIHTTQHVVTQQLSAVSNSLTLRCDHASYLWFPPRQSVHFPR